MRKRTITISLICILSATIIMIVVAAAGGRKPYKNLEAVQIISAAVQLSPPDKTIQITETKELVVRTGNPCAYFRSISPIAQVKKPRRSTTKTAKTREKGRTGSIFLIQCPPFRHICMN